MSERAHRRAVEVRTWLGVRDAQDLRDLRGLVEHRGAWVFVDDGLRTSIGRIVFPNDRPPIIRVSSTLDRERFRFTLAHEFGHFELHKKLQVQACHQEDVFSATSRLRIEREANAFAASFLMPRNEWRQHLGPLPLREPLHRLARTHEVSFVAAALRAIEVCPNPACLVSYHGDEHIQWAYANSDWDRLMRRRRPNQVELEWSCLARPMSNEYQEVEADVWGLPAEPHAIQEYTLREGDYPLVCLTLS